jgi:hypothetical protein
MANIYKTRPSEILKIEEEFVAYCFDEVCAFIIAKKESGESPKFIKEVKKSSFSEFYSGLNIE